MEIFDITNLQDIPLEIKEGLSGDLFAERIIELFNIAKRPLHIDEITVAYYRKYNDIKTKRQIMTKLYNIAMQPNSKIKSCLCKKGFYELKK